MYTATTTIINPTGLHARPASDFVSMAKTYRSKITIRDLSPEGRSGNAKSIITLLTLGLTKGKNIEIQAEGEDEEAAVTHLVELIQSGFGEL